MNMGNDTQIISRDYCSITSDILKCLPKCELPFCLYRINTHTGHFTPATTPNKTLVSNEKKIIYNDCERGLIFIKCTDIPECIPHFTSNLELVISDISHLIPEDHLVQILMEGLKEAAHSIFKDSFKINFEKFHTKITAVGELLYYEPHLIWKLIPLLDKTHSLANKSIANGIIGAGIFLHAREIKPDLCNFLETIYALFLCDIGMTCLPDFVLGKEFSLSIEEKKRIKLHPVNALEILSTTKKLSKNSLVAILEHHERLDGSGYPRGVKGDEISWLGKLCGAVDSFVAMTMMRPGKKTMSTINALKRLYKESTLYEPNIIYALEKVTYRNGS